MKLNFFRRKAQDQKKKAQARSMKRLQNFFEKAATTGMADVEKEVAQIRTEYEALMKETREILPLMDQEIAEKKAAGEDTTSQEQARQELAQSLDEVEKALAAVPASPFTAPSQGEPAEQQA